MNIPANPRFFFIEVGFKGVYFSWTRFPDEQGINPTSVLVRTSASGAGGRGFDHGPDHTKDLKMVPVATLLGA